MRLARLFFLALIFATFACGQPVAAKAEPPRCAKTFVIAITSSSATPGVWNCLSDAYQGRVQGHGDAVFALNTPLWTRYHYVGQDRDISIFNLTVSAYVEPAVYDPPVSQVIMAVYLDKDGRVDRAKAATPV